MELKIDVNVTAPELADSIKSLAAAISAVHCAANSNEESPAIKSVQVSKPTDNDEESAGSKNVENTNHSNEPSKERAETKKSATKAITLEDVRAKLAALSQDGKQAEVKALITEFGAKKLSDVPADKYSELLAKAEVL